MRRAIVMILDGLRRDMVRPDLTPNLCRLAEQAETFGSHKSVFPSATRVVSSSMATGCLPIRHGLAGNSTALLENGKLVAHDAGDPNFLQHKRTVTGRSLAMPTMAERVKGHGGAIIYANVSPGAGYAHDPDGHGIVYHRVGSYGPGRVPITDWDASQLTSDPEGDRVMARRFIADILDGDRKPALGMIWFADPDFSSHAHPLGSPEQLRAVRESDATAGLVIDSVEAARTRGEEILLIVGSDHGHQTVTGVVDIEAELVRGGIKAGEGSGDVISTSNGTSALIFVHPEHEALIPQIGAFLEQQSWAQEVIGPEGLAGVGQCAGDQGLAFAVGMASTEDANAFGVPGCSLVARPSLGKSDRLNCGQHGGFARYEQAPFLMISGDRFDGGGMRSEATSAVDIAPTVLRHLGIEHEPLDGRPLQR